MPPSAAAAVATAFALDLILREPPRRIHPVAAFGAAVEKLDRSYRRPGAAGAAVAVTLPLSAAAAAFLLTAAAYELHVAAAAAVAALLLFTSTSLRLLVETAQEAVAASDDPSRSQVILPALVGRDPKELSPAHVRSAAVESASENLADGLVAPLMAFTVFAPFSLAAAAAAAVYVKAVNTLDSTLGYPDKPHGAASARLDDVVNWLPSRATAALLAAAALEPAAAWRARKSADQPLSPNSGWSMSATAQAMNSTLEKPGEYTLNPDAGLPDEETARDAIRTVAVAGVLAYLAAVVVSWA